MADQYIPQAQPQYPQQPQPYSNPPMPTPIQAAPSYQGGIDIDDLVAGERTIPVRFGPATVNVTYDPRRVTGAIVDARSGDLGEVARGVGRIVKAWDLQRSGVPIPLTAEALIGTIDADGQQRDGVAIGILQVILSSVIEDAIVPPQTARR